MSEMLGVVVNTACSYRRYLITKLPNEIPINHVVVDVDIAILRGSTHDLENRLMLRGDREGKSWTYRHQRLKRVKVHHLRRSGIGGGGGSQKSAAVGVPGTAEGTWAG